jgi:hypothetical protein
VGFYERVTPNASRSRDEWQRPQFGDQPEDFGEKVSRNGDLSHLEGDIAPVVDDLRADLDQLLLETCQRPVRDRLRRRQRAQEVAEIVGERMKLKADGIGGERAAGKPRPFDRALALLDPLLARAALVVEANDVLGRPRHVGHDKPDARVEFARMPFDLGDDATRLVQVPA